MCGIFGILAPEAKPDWIAQVVQKLFAASIPRGKDSSGLAWVVKNKKNHRIEVLKKSVPGNEFQYDTDLLEVLYEQEPKVLIGHVRNLSQGKAENNENNHPLLSEVTGLALVHNGRVHDFIWRTKNEEEENPYILGDFKAEVDTEAILRLVDTLLYIPRNDDGTIDPQVVAATPKEDWNYDNPTSTFKAIDDAIFNLSGKNTCALLDPDEPLSIFMWRVDKPLYLAYVPEHKALVFASEKKFIEEALSEEVVKKLFNFIPLETLKKKTDFKGMDVQDTCLIQVTWTGEEGNEFKFEWTLSNPDGADFSAVAETDRTVATKNGNKKVTVN